MVKIGSRRFERYVAIGDSSTEGLNDPDGKGGYRGWSRRLAARIAEVQGELLYANFGARGLTTRNILDRQFEPAASMQPDLVTMFSGTNDVIRKHFDPQSIANDMGQMQRAFIRNGARVLTFTLPDLTPIMPMARRAAPRIRAMNDAVRATATRTGATLIDFAAYPVAIDPRLWHEDRLHANSAGHARIADALSFALELPGSDHSWREDLPPQPPPTLGRKLVAEIRWMRCYLLPWIGRRVGARFMGAEERERRRPCLEPIRPEA